MVKEEYEDIVKNEVQRAIAADEFHVNLQGEMCPFCRHMYNERLAQPEEGCVNPFMVLHED